MLVQVCPLALFKQHAFGLFGCLLQCMSKEAEMTSPASTAKIHQYTAHNQADIVHAPRLPMHITLSAVVSCTSAV